MLKTKQTQSNLFLGAFSKLPLREKFVLSEFFSKNPETFSYLEKLFYKKIEALKKKDKRAVLDVYEYEKEQVNKILAELIKESYEK